MIWLPHKMSYCGCMEQCYIECLAQYPTFDDASIYLNKFMSFFLQNSVWGVQKCCGQVWLDEWCYELWHSQTLERPFYTENVSSGRYQTVRCSRRHRYDGFKQAFIWSVARKFLISFLIDENYVNCNIYILYIYRTSIIS